MPMSRLPRSDWLGSMISPPLMTRSNLSFGPMAACVGVGRPPSAAVAAEARVSVRQRRRDTAFMAVLPGDRGEGALNGQGSQGRERLWTEKNLFFLDRR